MLDKEKTDRVMLEKQLREAEALALERQSQVIERERVQANMNVEIETAKKEIEGERKRHARVAVEWATKERQLNEEIKRT